MLVNRRFLANRFNIDIPLLISLLILCGIGLAVLYSASGQNHDMMIRQLIRLVLGFGVMVVMAYIPVPTLSRWAPWIYLLGVFLLAIVLTVGETSMGAQRWLNLGFFRFQPSELMKLAVPLVVAWYLKDRSLPPNLRRIMISLTLIAIPAFLIVKQPDLGTALLIVAAGLFVIFLSGISLRFMILSGIIILAAAPLLWFKMRDYQQQRVLTMLDPEKDPLGAGYHIIQSKIAIGSGGFYGKGWLNGSQSHLEFLPEGSTDFIFAVFSEEFGFLGVLVLLAIYLFIIFRGLYIAMQAQSTFGRLLAGSLILTFFIYLFVNIGMVIGRLPVVGVPLPLVSYGGTSLVTLLAGFGMLMGIHNHRRLLPM